MANKQVKQFNSMLPETARVSLQPSESGYKYMFVRGDGVRSKVYGSIKLANQAFVEGRIEWRGEK